MALWNEGMILPIQLPDKDSVFCSDSNPALVVCVNYCYSTTAYSIQNAVNHLCNKKKKVLVVLRGRNEAKPHLDKRVRRNAFLSRQTMTSVDEVAVLQQVPVSPFNRSPSVASLSKTISEFTL